MKIAETMILSFDVCKKKNELREDYDDYSSLVDPNKIIKDKLEDGELYHISITLTRK